MGGKSVKKSTPPLHSPQMLQEKESGRKTSYKSFKGPSLIALPCTSNYICLIKKKSVFIPAKIFKL